MGDEYDVEKIGPDTYRVTPRSGGVCIGILALVLVIIVGVIIAAIVGTFQQMIPKPPPPWHVELSSDNAQHIGPFATNEAGSHVNDPNGLQSGASLNFTGITPPRAGTYTLTFGNKGSWGWTGSTQTYTLSVVVNGKVQSKFDINENNQAFPQSFDINLAGGSNTIQLKLAGSDDHYYGNTTYVFIEGITLDE